MLIIWDIHLQAKHWERLIYELENYIARHDDEKNIVFVWDYVYHFSYHRKSLLRLFTFFLSLAKDWKNVYVLAWNHDWLWEHFVFAEWKHALDVMNEMWKDSEGKIHFITEPMQTNIEGQDILFLPFLLDKTVFEKNMDLTHDRMSPHWFQNSVLEKIYLTGKKLQESDNKYEQFSGRLNEYLALEVAQWIENNKQDDMKLHVIHHYYLADKQFPWQKWRYYFKDIALSSDWLKINMVKLISGHIHQPFCVDNYLCVWSIWSTSPLELNQCKYLWKYDNSRKVYVAEEFHFNPYIRISHEDIDTAIDNQYLHTFISKVFVESRENLQSSSRKIEFIEKIVENLNTINLSVLSPSIDYSKLNDIIDEELQTEVQSIKLSKKQAKMEDLLNKLDTETMDFSGGWHDWKTILDDYLVKKYWDEIELYKAELQELGLH